MSLKSSPWCLEPFLYQDTRASMLRAGQTKSETIMVRDAPIISIGRLSSVLPIIGIGRLLCRYRPIVIYYVLWWHWILKLYISFNLNGRQIFVL